MLPHRRFASPLAGEAAIASIDAIAGEGYASTSPTLESCSLDCFASDRPILRMRVRPRAVAPVKRLAVEFARPGAELVERQRGRKRLAIRIIFERGPRQRIMTMAAEQSAGPDHRIGDPPALLVEHQPLDDAELCTVASVDADIFHAITGDHGMRHGSLPGIVPVLLRATTIALQHASVVRYAPQQRPAGACQFVWPRRDPYRQALL